MKLLNIKQKKVVLNITPLIDVLFILIIFFIVTSTFLEQPGIKLELPEAESAELQKVEKALLTISQDSKLFFKGEKVTLENLPATLREAMEQSSDKSLIVSADKTIHHGLVVKIMDIARQNGVGKLVVSTEPEQ
ncbi:MAG: hypothetical protein GWN16_05450 [Calditrichae bacterium]|nr:hypothetical protein [Calditrichia bacterium]